jgi:Amidohydrolase family
MRCVRRFLIGVALLAAAPGDPALSQDADVVLLNGKIVPLGAPPVEALAVRDGKIVQLGRSGDIARLAGTATRVIDLGGRTVIPGLIDSHMHAIRAALFYATEVNWLAAAVMAVTERRFEDPDSTSIGQSPVAQKIEVSLLLGCQQTQTGDCRIHSMLSKLGLELPTSCATSGVPSRVGFSVHSGWDCVLFLEQCRIHPTHPAFEFVILHP